MTGPTDIFGLHPLPAPPPPHAPSAALSTRPAIQRISRWLKLLTGASRVEALSSPGLSSFGGDES